jgi:hypothetical protein
LRISGSAAKKMVGQWALNKSREKFAELSTDGETSLKVGKFSMWLFQSPDVQVEEHEIEKLEKTVEELSEKEITRLGLPGVLLRNRLKAQFLSESTLKSIVLLEIARREKLEKLANEKRKRVRDNVIWLFTEIITIGIAIIGWFYFK